MFSCVHFRRTAMMPGLFDEQFLLRKLGEEGDPLARLNSIVDWKIFLPILENALGAKDCSSPRRKPYPPLFMFKILILQSLYNLPDGRVERLLTRDLLARRFVGLSGRDLPPDFTTIWRFKEALTRAGSSSRAALASTISPETGMKRPLTDLTDSTEPNSLPASTCSPWAETSTKATSPS